MGTFTHIVILTADPKEVEIVISISQMRKKLRKATYLVQNHLAHLWQSRDVKMPDSTLLFLMPQLLYEPD